MRITITVMTTPSPPPPGSATERVWMGSCQYSPSIWSAEKSICGEGNRAVRLLKASKWKQKWLPLRSGQLHQATEEEGRRLTALSGTRLLMNWQAVKGRSLQSSLHNTC